MISPKTQALVHRRWTAFCESIVQAQEEHGSPVQCFFGEGSSVVDRVRMEAHCDGRDGTGGVDYASGGAVLFDLPSVSGFHQDGGGW